MQNLRVFCSFLEALTDCQLRLAARSENVQVLQMVLKIVVQIDSGTDSGADGGAGNTLLFLVFENVKPSKGLPWMDNLFPCWCSQILILACG